MQECYATRPCTDRTSFIGLTGDVVGRLIKRTALNPAFTLALILLARYTRRGSDLALLHPTSLSRLRKLFYFGLFRWATAWLDAGVLDNWKNDKYDWEDKEVVLVTGGAGGIGGQVVKLLAERNVKVVVLDVIPMTFEAGKSRWLFFHRYEYRDPVRLLEPKLWQDYGILLLN